MAPDYTTTLVNTTLSTALSNETFRKLIDRFPVDDFAPFFGDQIKTISTKKRTIQLVCDCFQHIGTHKDSDQTKVLKKVMLDSLDKMSSLYLHAEVAKNIFLAHISCIASCDR